MATTPFIRAFLHRNRSFHVYNNSDGSFHILAVDDDGGYIFADKLNSSEEAEWTAGLLNAAIGAASPLQ